MEIRTFSFDEAGHKELFSVSKGKNWPVVYLITNDREIYIGETTSAEKRMKEHMNNPEKQRHHFTHFHVIFDDIFNKSVILDYEQKLIKLFVADKKYIVTNRNDGQSSAHDYYDRAGGYTNHFTEIWGTLKDMGFVKRELNSLENLNLFKYSPYTALNEEQDGICTNLIEDFLERIEKDPDNPMGISLIKGGAGTGKTVLAISLVNSLMKAETIDEGSLESDELESAKVKVLLRLKKHILSSQGHPLKIGLVFPMPNIRNTIERVFRESAGGLSAKMVLSRLIYGLT